jgi:hypothetical protein
MPRNVTYSLEEQEIDLIDGLAEALGLSKTGVLRLGMSTLNGIVRVAQRDANGMLAVIRELYPEQEIELWVTQGADGQAEAHVRVDGTEPADLGARAIPSGDVAHIFLDLNVSGAYADMLVPVGVDAIRIRPRFAVGKLPWPPQNYRIVLPVKELSPTVPPSVATRLETVGA